MDDFATYSLSEELNRLPLGPAGKRSISLVHSDQIRVVLVSMTVGGMLAEHSAPGRITIHPIDGQFTVGIGSDVREASSDMLLTIRAGVRHSVTCREDGAFLLTIAASENARGNPLSDV